MNLSYSHTRWLTAFTLISLFTLGACSDDEDAGPSLNGNNTIYPLREISGSGIDGTVTFAELTDGSTTVVLDLEGTTSGNMHPAHIHFNTAAEGGGIAISLEAVDGASGSSTTLVSALDDGTGITYNQLILFDGYVNVHESEANLQSLIAQGDIGQNALTGEQQTYDLTALNNSGVSGSAIFYERLNHETLVELDVTGTSADGLHPAHIHINTAAEGGSIAISLNDVNGATGSSMTNVFKLDDAAGGQTVEYSDLTGFDGYINIHQSADDLGTVISQGDIGQNAFTGEQTSYMLNEVNTSGVSGEAIFHQRVNNETLIELILAGTPADGTHPAHIHMNSAAEGGGIVISLTPVTGATGYSATQVAAIDAAAGGEAVTYDDLLLYDGYINVHLSPEQLGIIVAQGDIGANAP